MSTDLTGGEASSSGTTPKALDIADASRRLIEEPFNTGNLELQDSLVGSDCVNHDPALPAELQAMRGPEVARRTTTMYRAAFPDLKMVVDDVIVAGDKAAVRWHAEGTHRGDLMGLAPTGARGVVTGIQIFLWKDGKVAESWTEWDNLGLARQLGAMPPEGSVGEKLATGMQRVMASWMRKKNQGT